MGVDAGGGLSLPQGEGGPGGYPREIFEIGLIRSKFLVISYLVELFLSGLYRLEHIPGLFLSGFYKSEDIPGLNCRA